MKQNELDGDPKFTITIELGGNFGKLLKKRQMTILNVEKSMQGLQKPDIEI